MPKLPDKPALMVYWQFWGNPRPNTYWTLHEGQEVQFKSPLLARAFAIQHGYIGIKLRAWSQVEHNPHTPYKSEPLPVS